MRYVLVHGVAHGGWCWEHVQGDLERAGHEVVAPDLPLTSLADDAAHVASLLDASSDRAVLVGHSYGGLVISQAATRARVAHLIYVAAFLVEPGADAAEVFGDAPNPVLAHMQIEGDAFSVRPASARSIFYNTCNETDALQASARLRPTALACIARPPDRSPWRDIPSTYVLCEQDAAIPASVQARMARSAGETISLDCDHSPFYSKREALVDVLVDSSTRETSG